MATLTAGRPPVRLTSLVGRASELRDVRQELATTRLLTLTGPGGTGKTRLALAAAAVAGDTFPGGVCWVELAPAADPASVGQTVASQLGAPDTPGQDAAEAIAEHVSGRRTLIVLDNCEHLAAAVAGLAERLLVACPALSILATSREPLGVEGECSWPVPPLSLPPGGAVVTATAAALGGSDAARLFEQRAQLVRPSFRVTDENAAAVLQICRRLDGLPLAIELAAARIRILPAAQLAERLDDIFAVLTGGARTAPRRHQALRATLDWSYDLLTADERAVFRRLAVFSGGFTLPAAEQVAAGGGIAGRDILDLLTRLAEKSLLRAEQPDGGARYHLLATIRDYARERLAETAEEEPARRAHLRYFTELAEQAGPLVERGLEGLEKELDRLDTERPNLRTALEFARQSGRGEAALRLAGQLGRYAYSARALSRNPAVDGPGRAGRRGRARRTAGEGPARQRPAWRCCSATTHRRCGCSMRRCACTGSWGTPGASPARCRCWAVSPASRAATPGRRGCTRRAWPSRRLPVTGGRWPARTATWGSSRGCRAASAGPPRNARRRWSSSASWGTSREPRGRCSAWARWPGTRATPSVPRICSGRAGRCRCASASVKASPGRSSSWACSRPARRPRRGRAAAPQPRAAS